MWKFKDSYGCIGVVKKLADGKFRLQIFNYNGREFYNNQLKSLASCKRVMSRFSDGTMKEIID